MIHFDPDEHVVLEIRKHWFVFFSHGFFLAVSAIVPFVAYEVVSKYLNFTIPISGNISGLMTFLYALWLLVLWISFFIQWTNYYLDVWYITEKRIIDVEQKRMFHRSVSSLRFDRIQDISIDVSGIISTFFNIGDIRVQTAAESSSDFFMKNADSPDRVRNLIFGQHNKEAEKSLHVTITDRNNGASSQK